MKQKSNVVILNNMLDTIGNTPVVELKSNFIPQNKQILLKLEEFNPCGSIKDRTVIGVIKDAEQKKLIKTGDTLIETASGNV